MLAVNGKCLAYHGPLLYEAKILQIFKDNQLQTKDSTVTLNNNKETLPQPIPTNILNDKHNTAYLIHYKGWKSTWDEWVNDERILEINNESLSLQKKLKDEILKNINKKNNENSTGTTSKKDNSSNTSGVKSKRKRNYDESLQKLHDFYSKPEIHLILPNSLKSILVHDWEQITKNHLLINVNNNNDNEKPSVYEILDDFQQWMLDNINNFDNDNSFDETILKEVIAGLKKYFDVSLGSLLLYKFERGQYKKIIHDEKNQVLSESSSNAKKRRKISKREEQQDSSLTILPGTIYGFQHLLRLLSILPNLIAQTNMDQVSVGILKNYLDQLALFLSSNSKSFLMDYENVTPSYETLNKL